MLKILIKFLLLLNVLQTMQAHVIKNLSRKPTVRESILHGDLTTTPGLTGRNNAGCDAIINSCGPNGGCCDEHDQCYELNKCTALSWIPGVQGLNCWNCNWKVMKCVVMLNPGMSSCCSAGTCGQDETVLEAQA
ncbi:unnamed protein product [Adineta ricciae]|uniref:Uncharacterized protein n=1 Tax=Adineta ricciae TaxID=249248 RepID=A0A815ANQ6_ADIRI|nr:unnamed protein product [Adineta ricciae]CAF1372871.1 unnamed protein product [Adineta ricciae]